ncbi:cysteine desulfurase family protein [Lacinutrix undariae]
MKKVYLDNAATTPMRNEVIEKMTDVMRTNFGNPSSIHGFGRSSKALIEKSRKTIATFFKVSASEIAFTSGGTEADNFILRSCVRDLGVTEIITSKIEHHAVLHTVEALEAEFGISVKYVALDALGMIDYNDLECLLQSNQKQLVSLMHVNNEIGNLLDLKRVAQLCQSNKALFHSDTVQSVGHYNIDLNEIPVDFIVASAHKFHGPKGVGFAFIRKKSGLKGSIFGGEQERGFRAGTESIHNIIGLETALKIAYSNKAEDTTYITNLKTYFITQLTTAFPGVSFNGNCANFTESAYAIINVCLPIAAEKSSLLQFQLDLQGIACSRGSACQSGSSKASHVLLEILDSEQVKKPSLRFSMSSFNTEEDINYVIEVLKSFMKVN